MKKLLYSIALVFVIAMSLSACTKEIVNPAESNNSGGGVSAPKGT
ncbi:MAG: hypothetical protein OJF59_003121 [Cytophagales bacterium]|jgi:hypothetical protein|nr:MAG: hypothetical protein OJF59_003117 [Cytophagales bacterium]WHZ09362.1 MAG: hypothetical protein OJF59_003118 [Cytophagales bacterium]WHZ09363.1 MAG: hypothetical protein OJF59_003119 [Cytophagales bacterium]WHZ09364.1 MAG: hypothetical protein OJF59_003120 [Cytophagales bacterium]WHZ09365.1 MAG: hypothetical protein OJF59_003121 [Cytophagales bacterium]